MDKVRYFLKTFSGLEWSGPAWYSHVKDENGFPSIVTLEYFHPLHLGDSSSTDWDGEELIKIYKPLRKKFPEIGKSWVQGNIHSHHGMGAFYSSTDVQQCIDGANENFYYSLVVSTKPGKELHFGVSYPDQFGQIHVVEITDFEVENNFLVDKQWEKQAKFIKKAKEKETPKPYIYNRRGYNSQINTNQATLFGAPPKEAKPQQSDLYDDIWDYGYDYATFDEFDSVLLDYDRGKISKTERDKQLKKLGVDEYGRPLPS